MEYIVKLINDARRVDAVNAVINLVGTLFSDSKSLLSDKNQIFLLFPLSVSFPTPLGIFHAYTKPERERKKRGEKRREKVCCHCSCDPIFFSLGFVARRRHVEDEKQRRLARNVSQRKIIPLFPALRDPCLDYTYT